MRPETIESLFVLYRVTKKEIYRDWGWEIFKSIERYCKTPTAYTGLKDVNNVEESSWNNSMQSFFFAETLKYLYLLFSDDSLIDLVCTRRYAELGFSVMLCEIALVLDLYLYCFAFVLDFIGFHSDRNFHIAFFL